jgi:hypothetical protein
MKDKPLSASSNTRGRRLRRRAIPLGDDNAVLQEQPHMRQDKPGFPPLIRH